MRKIGGNGAIGESLTPGTPGSPGTEREALLVMAQFQVSKIVESHE
jgi:hypothetical protein